MNWDQVQGNWKQMKGSIREKWGKLTDDDLAVIAGHRDKFIGKVQERYGIAKEEAQKMTDEWVRMLQHSPEHAQPQKTSPEHAQPQKTPEHAQPQKTFGSGGRA